MSNDREYLHQIGRFTVRLEQDEDPISPSEDQDDGAFLVAGHRSFYVPGPGEKRVRETFDEYLRQYGKTHWVFPIEAYIHSCVILAFSQEGNFPDRQWDVSQVGAIFCAKSEWRLSKSARRYAAGLLETWNQYLSGDVWGYIVEEHATDDPESDVIEQGDSCWGFFGRKYAEKEAREALESAAKSGEEIPTMKAQGVA